ncbi:hypothetical protein HK102_013004, partial [Quaeritorhiza haematococci]
CNLEQTKCIDPSNGQCVGIPKKKAKDPANGECSGQNYPTSPTLSFAISSKDAQLIQKGVEECIAIPTNWQPDAATGHCKRNGNTCISSKKKGSKRRRALDWLLPPAAPMSKTINRRQVGAGVGGGGSGDSGDSTPPPDSNLPDPPLPVDPDLSIELIDEPGEFADQDGFCVYCKSFPEKCLDRLNNECIDIPRDKFRDEEGDCA